MKITKSIFLYLSVFLSLGIGSLHAQDLNKEQFEEKLKQRVKIFEDFVHRFNFEKLPNQEAIPDTLLKTPKFKEQYLLSLFDSKGKFVNDKVNQKQMIAFVKQIIDKKEKITQYEGDITAEVDFLVKYKGKETLIQLFFEIEKVANGGKKWVITSVKAPFISPKSIGDKAIFFPPNSDGNGFIGIPKRMNKKQNVTELYKKNFVYEPLSAFYSAIQQGDLVLLNAKRFAYHVWQIKGWYFRLSFFNREALNSGWLIADLKKIDL